MSTATVSERQWYSVVSIDTIEHALVISLGDTYLDERSTFFLLAANVWRASACSHPSYSDLYPVY
eukprot:COSAG02_NODE_12066_length_1604_cov_1.534219_2_plen_64_part_01